MAKGASAEKAVKEIRRKTRRKFSAEEKVRIVLEGLRGEESIATLCRREGIVANPYYLPGFGVPNTSISASPMFRVLALTASIVRRRLVMTLGGKRISTPPPA